MYIVFFLFLSFAIFIVVDDFFVQKIYRHKHFFLFLIVIKVLISYFLYSNNLFDRSDSTKFDDIIMAINVGIVPPECGSLWGSDFFACFYGYVNSFLYIPRFLNIVIWIVTTFLIFNICCQFIDYRRSTTSMILVTIIFINPVVLGYEMITIRTPLYFIFTYCLIRSSIQEDPISWSRLSALAGGSGLVVLHPGFIPIAIYTLWYFFCSDKPLKMWQVNGLNTKLLWLLFGFICILAFLLSVFDVVSFQNQLDVLAGRNIGRFAFFEESFGKSIVDFILTFTGFLSDGLDGFSMLLSIYCSVLIIGLGLFCIYLFSHRPLLCISVCLSMGLFILGTGNVGTAVRHASGFYLFAVVGYLCLWNHDLGGVKH